MKRIYYHPEKGMVYMLFSWSDTLKYFDVRRRELTGMKTSLQQMTERDTSLRIQGRKCRAIDVKLYNTDGTIHYTEEQVFVYAPGYLNIDRNKFKPYKFMYWDQLVGMAGSYYVYFETNVPHVGKRMFSLVKAESKKLPDQLFDISGQEIKLFDGI